MVRLAKHQPTHFIDRYNYYLWNYSPFRAPALVSETIVVSRYKQPPLDYRGVSYNARFLISRYIHGKKKPLSEAQMNRGLVFGDEFFEPFLVDPQYPTFLRKEVSMCRG